MHHRDVMLVPMIVALCESVSLLTVSGKMSCVGTVKLVAGRSFSSVAPIPQNRSRGQMQDTLHATASESMLAYDHSRRMATYAVRMAALESSYSCKSIHPDVNQEPGCSFAL
jgi:hypothetical protein